ncbi:hypothetical protein OG586_00665 [Streptomyces murinus]|uniref:hypothetical protein n=1 Tax=Streptomyces murinus TaxID=33900 RepID=UPI002E8104A2|nr:hypothetical protein [Streptomyces murinus]WUD04820.1 hypothetical protein OG586_00665 [Streptomyces murinus]
MLAGALGGGGGGTAPTSPGDWVNSGVGGWQPGATYNFITKSWGTPFNPAGKSVDLFAGIPDWGMVHDPKAKNGWESSRSLFFG